MKTRAIFQGVFLFSLLVFAESLNADRKAPAVKPNIKIESDTSTQELNDLLRLRHLWKSAFGGEQESPDLKAKVETLPYQVIKLLREFIKERPDSVFVDEAKLMIAEAYRLTSEVDSDRQSYKFPKIQYNVYWKSEATFWLIDIVTNHPKSRYVSVMSGKDEGEYTAAIALWYLGLWNKDGRFLAKLASDYPASEYAQPALDKLKEAQERRGK